MTSWLLVLCCCLCWTRLPTCFAAAAAPTKTNILLLLTDDQDVLLGSFDTSTYMPILEKRLQHQGITFEKGGLVHVPICCPNRASLLTGKYLHHGSLAKNNSLEGDCYSQDWKTNEEDHNTIAVHAQAAGYTTLYAGKYLNRYQHDEDNVTVPSGWDYWYGLEGNSKYYNYTIVDKRPGNNTSNVTSNDNFQLHHHGDAYPEDYLPLVLEEYTLSVLPTLPEPWLAVVAWPTPHGPFTPEPKYAHEYSEAESPRKEDFNATETSQNQKHWLLRQLGVISNETLTLMEEIYKNRLRALKTVDDHIGKLMDWLEEGDRNDVALAKRNLGSNLNSQAIIDRTMIIYTSDNGFQFGQHRLSMDKRHLYEHDVRVPFVVRAPKALVAAENLVISKETIVSTLDIAPTILDIVVEGLSTTESGTSADSNHYAGNETLSSILRSAMDQMDGLSFWDYLRHLPAKQGESMNRSDDPFVQRTDLLISYHGEGYPPCFLAECPAPFDGLWWMPDSSNNTYHCVRTLRESTSLQDGEDSIYCVFYDDEDFVEYYDLFENPHQLGNDYESLSDTQIERYEIRLRELLS